MLCFRCVCGLRLALPLDARGANKNRRAPPHHRPPVFRRACPLLRRYASLYFLACVDDDDNELIVLETIHHFVEVLDRYFGNVCELDLIFNFHKAYHILDELLISGELQEPSKKAILRVTAAQDALMEGSSDSKVSDSKYEI